jgi:hypothetical protein
MYRASPGSRLSSLSFALLLAAACDVGGGPAPETAPGARLVIVGQDSLEVDTGAEVTLAVRYEDGTGEPLAGAISFSASGGLLSSVQVATDGDGVARVGLGVGEEASVRVTAEAAEAEPVAWRVDVRRDAELDPSGGYLVESTFRVSGAISAAMAPAGDPLDAMSEAPATWLLDQIVEQIGSSFWRGVVESFRPGLDAELDKAIHEDGRQRIRQLAAGLGGAIGDLRVRSTLAIEPVGGAPGELRASHRLTGIGISLAGRDFQIELAGYGPPILAEEIPVSVAQGRLQLGEHALEVEAGQLLVAVINQLVVPAIDPQAGSIGQLLERAVDCAAIGWLVDGWVGAGGLLAGLVRNQCMSAVGAVGDGIERALLRLDATAAALRASGEAAALDRNGDRIVDELGEGRWTGSLELGGVARELEDPLHTFRAVRQP